MLPPLTLLPIHPQLVIVWDFDHSLINCNSDTFVPENCLPLLCDFISEGSKTTQWTTLMAEVALKMFEGGVERSQIEAALEKMPVFSEVIESIRYASSLGVKQYIISDANTVYISQFLKSKCLDQHFTSVISNPASWTEKGLLEIHPYHSHHNCSRCPSNLCKGLVIDSTMSTLSSECRILYIGDGGGDLCPCLRLRKNDSIAARSGYKLAQLLQNIDALEASVSNWHDGQSLAHVINRFIITHV